MLPLRVLLVLVALSATALADPSRWRAEWPQTDFTRKSVESWAEIASGGPGRDGIPAIHAPRFVPAARSVLPEREPVMVFAPEGHPARAYPIRYLLWHEIVNDEVGGVPIAVTFCPLCNSGRVFDRRVAGRTLSFGVTGKLRRSDMVMYDLQTESWWQQATGRGIVGAMTGAELTALPATTESWAGFRAAHPGGRVMAEPGWPRDYGANPYAGYDTSARPFLYGGEMPPHGIAPLARVVQVGNRAWPLERLAREGTITEAGVTLSWQAGQASALDTREIARGRDVGSVRVTDPAGNPLPHDIPFAFAFHAFHPAGAWMLSGG